MQVGTLVIFFLFPLLTLAKVATYHCNMLTDDYLPSGDSFVIRDKHGYVENDWYDDYKLKRTFYGKKIYTDSDYFMKKIQDKYNQPRLTGFYFSTPIQNNVLYKIRIIFNTFDLINSQVKGYWILTSKIIEAELADSSRKEKLVAEKNLLCSQIL